MILTLDWESAFGNSPQGRKVTLASMTTEEYVRDPEFKVHGVGLKLGDRPAKYLWRPGDIERAFDRLPWDELTVLCHHSHFDMAIMNWHYGIRPHFLLDTLSMGNALCPGDRVSLGKLAPRFLKREKGKELVFFRNKWELTEEDQQVMGGYCENDCELTYALFEVMMGEGAISCGMTGGFPEQELRIIDNTIRLFTEPVFEVNTPILVTEYHKELKDKRALMKRIGADKKQLSSNPQFADMLRDLGVEPPMKLSPAALKKGIELETYAFAKGDEAFKLLLEHQDERVRWLVEARMGVKSTLMETRSKRFYQIGKRGTLPIYLKYYAAHTGRYGGGDKINPQNMKRGSALRKSLVAPKGHKCVVVDKSQIEARMLVYWAGQEDMVDVFRRGEDPYNVMAGTIYGCVVDRKNVPADKNAGMVGKASILGCGYQMGWSKFQESLRIGFLGMPSMVFDEVYRSQLNVSVEAFCAQRSYKPGFGTLRDEALAVKPMNVDEYAHLMHCAVTKAIVDRYRKTNNKVVELWKEMGKHLQDISNGVEVSCGPRPLVTTCKQGLRMPNGMVLQYDELRKDPKGRWTYYGDKIKHLRTDIYDGKIVENVVQGLCRIDMADNIITIQSKLDLLPLDPGEISRIATHTHDEIVSIVPDRYAQLVLDMMGEVMDTAPWWCPDIPLASEGDFADSYGECK